MQMASTVEPALRPVVVPPPAQEIDLDRWYCVQATAVDQVRLEQGVRRSATVYFGDPFDPSVGENLGTAPDAALASRSAGTVAVSVPRSGVRVRAYV